MNSSDFRAELAKIMPGYEWTVHRQSKYSSASQDHWPLVASGIQSSGSNRLKSDATPAELRLVLDYMEGRR